MSVLSIALLRAQMETALDDDALTLLIDAEEATLARRVGPLSGTLAQTYRPQRAAPVVLLRPTLAVAVLDGDVVAGVTLADDGRTVTPNVGSWSGVVTATYVPSDAANVLSVLIELMRLRVTETGYTRENTDNYGYSNDEATRARRREGLIRSLLPKQGPASVRLLVAP